MKPYTVGVLAHVDAGKTTLIEQLLVASGMKKEAGRVDHGTAFLDTDSQEKARGITISSKMCRIRSDLSLILMDTPGHVDFTAESERVLPVLDAAILVIGAGERIPAHAQYLFRLLSERSIPTIVFFNKMDLPVPEPEILIQKIRESLGEGFAEWKGVEKQEDGTLLVADPLAAEEISVLDEVLMEQFLSDGFVTVSDCIKLFHRGIFFPCLFGSALQGDGVNELLTLLKLLNPELKEGTSAPFGAYCYKILYDEAGQRLSFLKILSGTLSVRETVSYFEKSRTPEDEKELTEKITEIRLYDGSSYTAAQTVETGEIVAVTGLTMTYAGCGIGTAPSAKPESSHPMLTYRMILPEGLDAREFLPKLLRLEEEEDTLSVDRRKENDDIYVELYGEVQLEILTEKIRERYGIDVTFDTGTVFYRETLAEPSYGMGHFEPLRHYAEVHLLLQPLPRGTGLIFDSELSTDELDRNWQQTILNALEQEHLTGVLANAKLTDLKISLVAGRSHKKHTEGGDFREAALRALRQGLMSAQSILLEPYVKFQLTVPQETVGRALFDMDQLASESSVTEQTGEQTTITGRGAVSKLRNYMAEVRTYTHGEGIFRMIYDGYDACPEQDAILSELSYQPEADLEHPAGSVFVSHGAAEYVPWQEAPERMHLESRFKRFYPDEEEESGDVNVRNISGRKRTSLTERLEAIGTDEIDAILQRAGHANQSGEKSSDQRKRWASANNRQSRETTTTGKTASKKPPLQKYLLVDGYNIIHAWDETRNIVNQNLDAARGILLDLLTDYRAMTDAEIIVVFDAYRVAGHRTETMEYQNLHVVYTKEAETADQYIARFSSEYSKKYDITVATSDGLIQLIIRGADARVLSARDLHDMIETQKNFIRETYLTEE